MILLFAVLDCVVINMVYVFGFCWSRCNDCDISVLTALPVRYLRHHRTCAMRPNPFWWQMRVYNLVCFLMIFIAEAYDNDNIYTIMTISAR